MFSHHTGASFSYCVLIVGVNNGTITVPFSYTDNFNVLANGPTGARVFSLPELHNVQFEFLDYVFIIIGPGGIYRPDYDVTGNLQQALSITMLEGDITQMRALMGINHEIAISL